MYSWNELGIKEMMSIYLYGSTVMPNNMVDPSLIRIVLPLNPDGTEPSFTLISVDGIGYMAKA